MSDPENAAAPAPDAAAPAVDAKAAEMAANLEFQAHLREVTPRVAVVPAILVLNVGVFAAMVASGVSAMNPRVLDLIKWGGNFGPRTLGGQPWRILTGAFLHSGVIHLAMNMFALWSTGLVIERIFGRARLASIYLCAAITGGIASVAIHPQITSIGASGAVFGLYGALGTFLLRERGSVPKLVVARLGRVAGSFVVLNIFYGFSHPAIDNAAHLGGLFGGALAGAWLARPLVLGRPTAPGRALSTLALSVAALVGAAFALPKPLDLAATISTFGEIETKTYATFNALLERARKQELGDSELATKIEHDILPPWRAGRAVMKAPRAWTPEQRAVLDRLGRYYDAREHAWELLARAAHTENRDDIAASKAADAEARRILDEVNKKP